MSLPVLDHYAWLINTIFYIAFVIFWSRDVDRNRKESYQLAVEHCVYQIRHLRLWCTNASQVLAYEACEKELKKMRTESEKW